MALIKKCATCSSKGLSLKLSDGLCPNCTEELKNIEQAYISTLQKLSTPTYDKIEITNSIKEILLKLPKFSNINTSVKIIDCINLLSNLTSNIETTINDMDSTKNSEFKEGEPVLTAYSYTEDMVSSKPINSTVFIDVDEDTIIDATCEIIDDDINNENSNTIEAIEPSESLLQHSVVDSNYEVWNDSEAEIKIDTELDTRNDIDVTCEVEAKAISENNMTEEYDDIPDEISEQHIDSINPIDSNDDTLEQSSSTVKNSLYAQTSELISILQDKHSSINDLAQNLFLLKDTYLPVLKENSIFEVDDVNLETLIKTVTKTLVIRTNQKEADLYDFFNYVAYAIQTNGIRPKFNDIIEISALKVRYGKIVDKFYTLVNPLKSIELHVQSTTGISNDSILDAPTFDIVIPDFIAFADGLKLISHNSKFMSAFLANKYNILYDEPLPNRLGCSMDLYRVRYKSYHGEPATAVDILTCAKDVLSSDNVITINSYNSIATSICYGTYELYEKLKFRYK